MTGIKFFAGKGLAMDEGLSLDTIVGILRGFLPTISYYVNLVNRLFDVFSSYIGFGNLGEDAAE